MYEILRKFSKSEPAADHTDTGASKSPGGLKFDSVLFCIYEREPKASAIDSF